MNTLVMKYFSLPGLIFVLSEVSSEGFISRYIIVLHIRTGYSWCSLKMFFPFHQRNFIRAVTWSKKTFLRFNLLKLSISKGNLKTN